MIRTLAAALATSTCIVALATPAAAQTREYNIPAGSLKSALDAYVRQSGRQVVYRADQVRSARSPGTRGQQSAEAALAAILSGSGFTTRVDGNLVAIVRGGNDQVADDPSLRKDDPTATADETAEIVVTGSNIRGVVNETVPLTVLTKKDIEESGAGTVGRLFETLPQNFGIVNESVSSQGIPGATSVLTQGAAVTLRATGQGTTLTLLNGRRLAPGFSSTAVDISGIPLTAVDRVEIVTDGASALYGGDAVGGVVNFVLREKYDGAETRIRGGWADGVKEYRLAQTFGASWKSGSALITGQYYYRSLLDADDRSFVPAASDVGSLLPENKTISVLTSVHQDIFSFVKFRGHAYFNKRNTFNIMGQEQLNQSFRSTVYAALADGGLEWDLGSGWTLDTSASYSWQKSESYAQASNSDALNRFGITTFTAKLDGSLLHMPGGDVRLAAGTEYRTEDYYQQTFLRAQNRLLIPYGASQNIWSAFGELYIPLVGPENAREGLNSLIVSLAGRYDRYSNFGNSFNPQIGAMWEVAKGMKFRASYNTSYKAPNLVNYTTLGNAAVAIGSFSDPGSPTGRSNIISVSGYDVASLKPERSRAYTLGVEFTPPPLQGLTLSANYYNIRYTDRIAGPTPNSTSQPILDNPAAYPGLLIRNPTEAQVNDAIAAGRAGQGFFIANWPGGSAAFQPSQVNVIVDVRTRNLSLVRTSGLDLQGDYRWSLGSGQAHAGIALTYVAKLEQQLTPAAITIDSVNKIYNPPSWKWRANAGWSNRSLSASVLVSHTNTYFDDRAATPVSLRSISSFTSVDAALSYRLPNQSGALSGLSFSITGQNIFDARPPRTSVNNPYELGFDPTNANPLGRMISVEMKKEF